MLPMMLLDAGAEGLPTWFVNVAFPAVCGLVAILARFSYATKEKALVAEIETAKSEAARAHTRIGESDRANSARFEEMTKRNHTVDLELCEIRVKNTLREEMRDREVTRETFIDRMAVQDRALELIGKRTGSISSMEAVRAQIPPRDRDERRDPTDPPPAPPPRRPPPPSRPGGR